MKLKIYILMFFTVFFELTYPSYSKVIDYKGIVTKVEIGNDSGSITIDVNGISKKFSITPSTDGFSKEELAVMRSINQWFPSFRLMGSNIKISATERGILLGYKVLKDAKSLWVVVVASKKISDNKNITNDLYEKERKVSDSGYSSMIVSSLDYESFKDGYHVVLAGGFTNYKDAINCQKKMKKIGFNDCYLKKLW